ncbi:coenzyme F420-0:L-glutamate ligase [Saxibacter everestensis]|uniref:Coenzyme F420-0:L-glutamate ligase n=1 Tax=Saxibacter everestensis TaxID=2909229 RepID=A0ABY8QQP9_9MICO|nr:coenzyme F420-0:L-glutamate ligase [Brevibacteriaceae bacterium ZFBP1038]
MSTDDALLISLFAVPKIPEIQAGDNLAIVISRSIRAAGIELRDGDIVTVASKVVAKAEGRFVPIATRADREGLITEQSHRVVAERSSSGGITQIVESAAGPVMAAAGIDTSNVPTGYALLLPHDADSSAAAIRNGLHERFGVDLGVIVTDTSSRPWRQGVTDFALGSSGVVLLDDLRGRQDALGSELKVTVRALADEIASAADLVKEKSRGLPVALVRGLGRWVVSGGVGGQDSGSLNRTEATDWFRFGHVEAIRSSLGLRTGEVDPPPADADHDDVPSRVNRAIAVATAGTSPLPGLAAWSLRSRSAGAVVRISLSEGGLHRLEASEPGAHPLMVATLALGSLIQRLETALWAEGLTGRPHTSWRPDGRVDVVEVHVATRRQH